MLVAHRGEEAVVGVVVDTNAEAQHLLVQTHGLIDGAVAPVDSFGHDTTTTTHCSTADSRSFSRSWPGVCVHPRAGLGFRV